MRLRLNIQANLNSTRVQRLPVTSSPQPCRSCHCCKTNEDLSSIHAVSSAWICPMSDHVLYRRPVTKHLPLQSQFLPPPANNYISSLAPTLVYFLNLHLNLLTFFILPGILTILNREASFILKIQNLQNQSYFQSCHVHFINLTDFDHFSFQYPAFIFLR